MQINQPNYMENLTQPALPVPLSRIVVHLDLWEEVETEKVWARATKRVDGNLMGLKCEMKIVGGKFRWMTLNPQKFGEADTFYEGIEQVELFLHNAKTQPTT